MSRTFIFLSALVMFLLAPPPPLQGIEPETEEIAYFIPPSGWQLADLSTLPVKHIKVIVVGKSNSQCAPWMNLCTEPYQGTLKQYLKMIKNKHQTKGEEWKDLGMIRTEAGQGHLSQSASKMPWGEMRLMHLILLKYGKIYILTAYALKEEFATFYKDFFGAMRSLRIGKDLYDLLPAEQRSPLKKAADQLMQQWEEKLAKQQKESPEMTIEDLQEKTFRSPSFQKEYWLPFQKRIQEKYQAIGPEWQSLFLQKMEDHLFNKGISKKNAEIETL